MGTTIFKCSAKSAQNTNSAHHHDIIGPVGPVFAGVQLVQLLYNLARQLQALCHDVRLIPPSYTNGHSD